MKGKKLLSWRSQLSAVLLRSTRCLPASLTVGMPYVSMPDCSMLTALLLTAKQNHILILPKQSSALAAFHSDSNRTSSLARLSSLALECRRR